MNFSFRNFQNLDNTSITPSKRAERDNITYLLSYDKQRVNESDYFLELDDLVSKSISYINSNRTLIFGRVKQVLQKYFPNITVEKIDVAFSQNDKACTIKVSYRFKDTNELDSAFATFI